MKKSNASKSFSLSQNLFKFGIVYLLIIQIIVASLLSKNFLTGSNMINVIRQASTTVIAALGMGMIIIIGGFDLSVGSVTALAGMLVAGAMVKWGFSVPLAVLFTLAVGFLYGFLNGIIIGKFQISPMIVTLATMNAARGIAMLYEDGAQIIGLPSAFAKIGRGYILGLPVPVWIMFVLIILVYLVVSKTVFGKYLYAIGGNEKVARMAGINVMATKVLAYSLCSVMASVVGIIYAARLNMGDPTVGEGVEMDAIASAVLGGINLYGGRGNILGAVAGALFISVLSNALNLIGISSFWQLVVKAFVLIVAAMIYTKRNSND